MPGRAKFIPLWFIAAFVPMVASQVIRLHQTSPLYWLLCDYSGRIGALLILAAIPAARAVAFRPQRLLTSWWETALWIVGLPVLFGTVCQWVSHSINYLIPHTLLGLFPAPQGWLNVFDLTAGLTLVAYHEETIFRRCAREVFNPVCGDGAIMVVLTSLLFAAYHWTTGLGNIAATFIFALFAMLGLRRTGALWPLVMAHFLTDFVRFTGISTYFLRFIGMS